MTELQTEIYRYCTLQASATAADDYNAIMAKAEELLTRRGEVDVFDLDSVVGILSDQWPAFGDEPDDPDVMAEMDRIWHRCEELEAA